MNIKIKTCIIYTLLILSFSGCIDENELFTGYLVGKEYIPEHMSNEQEQRINCAGVMPIIPHVPTVSHSHPPPTKVDPQYLWYIANKKEILKKYVTKELFNSKKCGDQITIKRY